MSFLVLGLCSQSTPLYAMNNWVDANCFFTVGEGIVHGVVPYQDLLEQKGSITAILAALLSGVEATADESLNQFIFKERISRLV